MRKIYCGRRDKENVMHERRGREGVVCLFYILKQIKGEISRDRDG